MFIQIGNIGLSTNHITGCHRFVDDGKMSIEVYRSDGGYFHLKDKDANAFATWWDNKMNYDSDSFYITGEDWYIEAENDPMEPDHAALAAEEAMTPGAQLRMDSGVGQ